MTRACVPRRPLSSPPTRPAICAKMMVTREGPPVCVKQVIVPKGALPEKTRPRSAAHPGGGSVHGMLRNHPPQGPRATRPPDPPRSRANQNEGLAPRLLNWRPRASVRAWKKRRLAAGGRGPGPKGMRSGTRISALRGEPSGLETANRQAKCENMRSQPRKNKEKGLIYAIAGPRLARA